MTATLGNTLGRRCRICGCSDKHPCVTSEGMTCAWVCSDICDFCESTVSAVAGWLALQGQNRREGADSARELLRVSVEVAHGLIDADDEERPRVLLVGEAEASAYLRAKGAPA